MRQATLQAAAVWSLLANSHSHESDERMPFTGWKFFTQEQAREVEAVTAQIIPYDGTAGAREAGVVRFIDMNLAQFEQAGQHIYRSGLTHLSEQAQKEGSAFSQLSDAKQHELLERIEQTEFFELVRTHTIMGFLSNPSYGGNQGKAGWKLIGFEDAFAFQPPFGYYDGAQKE